MCLGIPMRVTAMDEFTATVEARGAERVVSLLMYVDDDLALGDFVLVNLGHALQKMSAEEAEASWLLLDEIEQASRQ